jgi:hypothetical protein
MVLTAANCFPVFAGEELSKSCETAEVCSLREVAAAPVPVDEAGGTYAADSPLLDSVLGDSFETAATSGVTFHVCPLSAWTNRTRVPSVDL